MKKLARLYTKKSDRIIWLPYGKNGDGDIIHVKATVRNMQLAIIELLDIPSDVAKRMRKKELEKVLADILI